MMRKASYTRLTAPCVLTAALTLAACSSSSSPAPPVSGLSKATQRTQAQVAIAVSNGIQAASLIGVVLRSFHVNSATDSTKPVCKGGVETVLHVLNPEQVILTVDVFYDPHCATLLTKSKFDVTIFPPGRSSIAGTATTYDPSRKAVAYAAFTTKGTLGPIDRTTTTGSISLTPSGPAVLSFGLSCTLAKINRCGFGGIAVAAPQQQLGVSSNLVGFATSGIANGTVNLRAYQGTALKLVRGSGDSWSVSGGTRAATETGTFSEVVDPNTFNAAGTVALKDPGAGASASAAFGTRTGIANGSVVQTASSKNFAAYSADSVGSGTIDYSDGSRGTITLFIVTS